MTARGARSRIGWLGPRRPKTPRSIGAAACFVCNTSGVTAIEFAFLAPVVLYLILMTFQVGFYFYCKARLFSATTQAGRQIRTGSVANQGLTAAQFRNNLLCPMLPGSMPCSNIVTNSVVIPSGNYGAGWLPALNASRTGPLIPPMDNSKTSYCVGVSGSIVALQVFYAMPVIGIPPLLGVATKANNASVIFIQATAVWKNEPFTTSYGGC